MKKFNHTLTQSTFLAVRQLIPVVRQSLRRSFVLIVVGVFKYH